MRDLLALTLGMCACVPLHAQQAQSPWCFTMSCGQAPATSFAQPGNQKGWMRHLHPTWTAPAYSPPPLLNPAPSTGQFFLIGRPLMRTAGRDLPVSPVGRGVLRSGKQPGTPTISAGSSPDLGARAPGVEPGGTGFRPRAGKY